MSYVVIVGPQVRPDALMRGWSRSPYLERILSRFENGRIAAFRVGARSAGAMVFDTRDAAQAVADDLAGHVVAQ